MGMTTDTGLNNKIIQTFLHPSIEASTISCSSKEACLLSPWRNNSCVFSSFQSLITFLWVFDGTGWDRYKRTLYNKIRKKIANAEFHISCYRLSDDLKGKITCPVVFLEQVLFSCWVYIFTYILMTSNFRIEYIRYPHMPCTPGQAGRMKAGAGECVQSHISDLTHTLQWDSFFKHSLLHHLFILLSASSVSLNTFPKHRNIMFVTAAVSPAWSWAAIQDLSK